MQQFNIRRLALLEKMAPASAAVIFSAPEVTRNAGAYYPYRQNSDFWYLTGFNEPEAALLLIKRNKKCNYSVLFNRSCNLKSKIWYGGNLGQDAATSILMVDCALPFSDINQQLYLILNNLNIVYHAVGEYNYADRILYCVLDRLLKSKRQSLQVALIQSDWRPWLHEMRLFKSSEEIAIIRRACNISALAHVRAMKKCCPGMFEYQLEAEIHYECALLGARYQSYNPIVSSGANCCILHYTDNQSIMQDGHLVLIDAGCEYKGYASDITRTFPVNGKFSQPQRTVYDIVLAAQLYALKVLRPGVTIGEVNDQVVRIMIARLIDIGVMRGTVEQLFIDRDYRQFYMHGLSHWMGIDVHDVGSYVTPIGDRILKPGMVLTVEPGLYISSNAGVSEDYCGIGVRIEDDILITEDGNENLTANVAKKVDAIEALMASAGSL